MVRVVGREREERAPALERLVPVDGRVAAGDLELAAGVPHLDPEQPGAGLPLVGAQPAPVRVREIGETAVGRDPGHDLRQWRELVLGDDRVRLHPEGEHMCIVLRPTSGRVQLDGRDDEQLPGRALDRPDPVIRDRKDVISSPFVVPDELVRR